MNTSDSRKEAFGCVLITVRTQRPNAEFGRLVCHRAEPSNKQVGPLNALFFL